MGSLFVRRVTSEVAQGSGGDVLTLADGLIEIRVVRVRKGRVHLLVTAPDDIDISLGDKNEQGQICSNVDRQDG